MEVYHQPHAKRLCPSGLDQHVVLSAPSVFRIDPDTQSDGIHADLFHEGSTFDGVPVGPVELYTVLLHLSHPADVSTLGKLSFFDGVRRLILFITVVRILAA